MSDVGTAEIGIQHLLPPVKGKSTPTFMESPPKKMVEELRKQSLLLKKYEYLAGDLLTVMKDIKIKRPLIAEKGTRTTSFEEWASGGWKNTPPGELFGGEFLADCVATMEELKAEGVGNDLQIPIYKFAGFSNKQEYLDKRFYPTLAARINYNETLQADKSQLKKDKQLLNSLSKDIPLFEKRRKELSAHIDSLEYSISCDTQIVAGLDLELSSDRFSIRQYSL